MSDSSTQSRSSESGGQRRSGNRRNRNRSRNRNRNQGGGGGGGGNAPKGQGRRNNAGRRPPRREPKPVPLTFWQKVLKFFGLYKEPVRPPRKRKGTPTETPDAEPAQGSKKAPKSGTRIAKTAAREPKPVESTRLYLGNLSYDASEYELEDLFKGVGSVRNVEIVYNRNTHKSKGYGFIEMATIDEAKRAVEVLHDQPFMGRKMIVSGAKSKGPADDGDGSEEAS